MPYYKTKNKLTTKDMVSNLKQPIVLSDCYSVVIGEHPFVKPEYFSIKVYCMQEDEIQYTASDQAMERYQNAEDVKNVLDVPTSRLCTPKEAYLELERDNDNTKDMINLIKEYFNHMPHVLYWHNGNQPPKCQFHGLHLHGIVCKYDLTHQRIHKDMNMVINKKNHGLFRCQRVKYLPNLMKHLMEPPRRLTSCNNLDFAVKHKAANDMESVIPEKELMYNEGEEVTVNKPHEGTQYLTNLLSLEIPEEHSVEHKNEKIHELMDEVTEDPDFKMYDPTINHYTPGCTKQLDKYRYYVYKYNKYERSTMRDHLVQVERNMEEAADFMLMTSSTSGMAKFQTVVDLKKSEDEVVTPNYLEELFQYTLTETDNRGNIIMNIRDTTNLFLNWCDTQKIDPGDYLLKLYQILGKKQNKHNTFMLQGASNAGKTYWTNAVVPDLKNMGQTSNSERFAWESCIGKSVIMIPELNLVNPVEIQEFKKAAGGESFRAGIKGKPSQWLHKTPLLLTTNYVPWRACSDEREPLQSRIYGYSHLSSVNLFENMGAPNPMMFINIFKFIADTFPEEVQCMEPDEDEIWIYYTDLIKDRLIDMKTAALPCLSDLLRAIHLVYDEDTLPSQRRMEYNQMERFSLNTDSAIYEDLITYLDINQLPDAVDFHWNLDQYKKPFLYYKDEPLNTYDAITQNEMKYLESSLLHLRYISSTLKHWESCIVDEDSCMKPMMKLCINHMVTYLMDLRTKLKVIPSEINTTVQTELPHFEMLTDEVLKELDTDMDICSMDSYDSVHSSSDSQHSAYSNEHHRADMKKEKESESLLTFDTLKDGKDKEELKQCIQLVRQQVLKIQDTMGEVDTRLDANKEVNIMDDEEVMVKALGLFQDDEFTELDDLKTREEMVKVLDHTGLNQDHTDGIIRVLGNTISCCNTVTTSPAKEDYEKQMKEIQKKPHHQLGKKRGPYKKKDTPEISITKKRKIQQNEKDHPDGIKQMADFLINNNTLVIDEKEASQ